MCTTVEVLHTDGTSKAHANLLLCAGDPESSLSIRESKIQTPQASAVMSIVGRYPGSNSEAGIGGFWKVMQSEQDLPATIPLQRWDVDEYYSSESKSQQLSMYVRMAAFVDNLDHFDHGLFRCAIPQASIDDSYLWTASKILCLLLLRSLCFPGQHIAWLGLLALNFQAEHTASNRQLFAWSWTSE